LGERNDSCNKGQQKDSHARSLRLIDQFIYKNRAQLLGLVNTALQTLQSRQAITMMNDGIIA